MEALTEPFLTYERALLYGSTDQLPAVVEHDRQWPTVDLDDPASSSNGNVPLTPRSSGPIRRERHNDRDGDDTRPRRCTRWHGCST